MVLLEKLNYGSALDVRRAAFVSLMDIFGVINQMQDLSSCVIIQRAFLKCWRHVHCRNGPLQETKINNR